MHEFQQAARDSIGWCRTCLAFTRDCTEPDAEDYDCPVCENNSVVGAEYAMLLGYISFAEDAT